MLKLDDVRKGDTLIADGGFTCIPEGCELTVEQDEEGSLFVHCQDGEHHLVGQLEDDGTLVGLSRKA